jgi:hypothetical protein
MLTQHEVVPYLLARGFLTPKCIVDGDVAVVDASRRNHNFIIISPAGCYLLKQAVGLDRSETIAREASIYQALSSKALPNGFARYLPKFHAYDAEQHILILEFVQDAETLREQLWHTGGSSTHTAEHMADALAALHRVSCANVVLNSVAFTQVLPARLLHRPDLEIFRTASGAGIQLIKIIQRQRKLGELLDQLSEEWNAGAVIHGDVRGDAFLVPTRTTPGRKRWLKIVDFEYTCKGDPAWDLGSVFTEYISAWVFSVPLIGGSQPDRFIRLASCPLGKVQPLMRSFWRRYVFSMALEQSKSDHLLLRAVKYCGARLLHLAMEMTWASNSVGANQLCLLQVGTNILSQPEKAAVELLKIASRARRKQ